MWSSKKYRACELLAESWLRPSVEFGVTAVMKPAPTTIYLKLFSFWMFWCTGANNNVITERRCYARSTLYLRHLYLKSTERSESNPFRSIRKESKSKPTNVTFDFTLLFLTLSERMGKFTNHKRLGFANACRSTETPLLVLVLKIRAHVHAFMRLLEWHEVHQ